MPRKNIQQVDNEYGTLLNEVDKRLFVDLHDSAVFFGGYLAGVSGVPPEKMVGIQYIGCVQSF